MDGDKRNASTDRDICGFDEQIEGYEYRKLEKLPKEIVMEKIMAKLEEEKQTWE